MGRLVSFKEDTEAQQKLEALAADWHAIEAGGTRGFRLAFQEVFFERYQTPHIVRSLFPWFDPMGYIFAADTHEYFGWLCFTLICVGSA
jgi:hypothetical protein